MSKVRANNFTNKAGTGAPTFPYGANVTGVITATSFSGDGSGLAGVGVVGVDTTGTSTFNHINVTGVATAATLSVSGNATVTGNLTVSGTETIINTTTLEVEDKNIGISSVSPKLNDANLDGAGITIHGSEGDKTLTWSNSNSRMQFNTDLYATSFYGDGSNLTNVISGVELKQAGSSVGTGITQINFASGATLTTASSGVSTVTIAAGIQTEATVASGAVVTLDLSSAQDHKVTATGICTITCSGGTEADSHTVRIVNSGIATVGFSTYFLFPSGATPSLPTADGAISLISFTVHRVGAAGTQLLAGASVNFS